MKRNLKNKAKRCSIKATAKARRAGRIGSTRHAEAYDLAYFTCINTNRNLGGASRRRRVRRKSRR